MSGIPSHLCLFAEVSNGLYRGADPAQLEEKIRHWASVVSASSEPGGEAESAAVAGQLDLVPFLMKADCECLNESDGHMLGDCLNANPQSYLESDCDPQLIFRLVFNQAVKVHSVKFKSDAGQFGIYLLSGTSLIRQLCFNQNLDRRQ